MHLFVLLALTPAWAQVTTTSGPVVIDRVAVVVDGQVITASDLRLSIAIDGRDPSPLPMLKGPAHDPLQRLIDRTILRSLAGKVPVYQPDDADVRSRVDALRSTWDSLSEFRSFLLVHGLDEDRLHRRMTDRMVVERYIRRNLTPPAPSKEAPSLAQYTDWMAGLRAGVRIRKVQATKDAP